MYAQYRVELFVAQGIGADAASDKVMRMVISARRNETLDNFGRSGSSQVLSGGGSAARLGGDAVLIRPD